MNFYVFTTVIGGMVPLSKDFVDASPTVTDLKLEAAGSVAGGGFGTGFEYKNTLAITNAVPNANSMVGTKSKKYIEITQLNKMETEVAKPKKHALLSKGIIVK